MSAELLGTPRPFEWKGQHFLVAFRDLATESQFSEWVKAETALDLWRLKTKTPADFYADQMRLFNGKVAGKQFAWGSEDVYAASWSEVGQRQLLWLKIMRGAEKGGEVLEREMLDEIAADRDKWQQLLDIMHEQDYPDFFAYVTAERKKAGQTVPSPKQTGNPPSAPISQPAAASTSTT